MKNSLISNRLTSPCVANLAAPYKVSCLPTVYDPQRHWPWPLVALAFSFLLIGAAFCDGPPPVDDFDSPEQWIAWMVECYGTPAERKPGSGLAATAPPAPCASDNGCPIAMPDWRVTEPAVNLWLQDSPFRYHASRGRSVAFKLYFKNRQGTQNSVDNSEPTIFSVGAHWHTPWRSYLEAVSGESTNFWFWMCTKRCYYDCFSMSGGSLQTTSYSTTAPNWDGACGDIMYFPWKP